MDPARGRLAVSFLVSILVFLGLIGLRSTGSLESLELAAYDRYIRWRPQAAAPNSRVVLIAITERDIQHQGRWPLTDATLARALEMLAQYRPRAIGLDLVRDLPVPPGRERLEAILTGNRCIIAVMKFGNGVEMGIPPPPALQGTDRVGFGDVLVDPGGIVRRGLLFLDDGKTTAYSFALRLALVYLRAEGITPQPDGADPQHLRLGRTALRPFASNDGGYVGADARGYQFLLDFKDGPGSFPSFSLTALLTGQVDPKAIEGRVVLIGVVAESVKDFFYTPYSRGLQAGQRISGIALHAHIVSQLLRSGLEGATPVATASEWAEGLWILLWSVMGGAMGLWVQPAWRFSLLSAGVLLVPVLVAYGAFFLGGWWIPSVPPALAWLGSVLIVTVYMANWKRQWIEFLQKLFSMHSPIQISNHFKQLLDSLRKRF